MKPTRKPDAPERVTLAEFSSSAQRVDRLCAAVKFGTAIQHSEALFYLQSGVGGRVECHDDGSGFTVRFGERRQDFNGLADAESALYAWIGENRPHVLLRSSGDRR